MLPCTPKNVPTSLPLPLPGFAAAGFFLNFIVFCLVFFFVGFLFCFFFNVWYFVCHALVLLLLLLLIGGWGGLWRGWGCCVRGVLSVVMGALSFLGVEVVLGLGCVAICYRRRWCWLARSLPLLSAFSHCLCLSLFRCCLLAPSEELTNDPQPPRDLCMVLHKDEEKTATAHNLTRLLSTRKEGVAGPQHRKPSEL